MKRKTIINSIIIILILLILYSVEGHGFVKFYFGGKKEMLKAAEYINNLCNTNGSCSTSLDGWHAGSSGSATLSKGNMLYYVTPSVKGKNGTKSKDHQSFRLVCRFFMPDHWFEA